MLPSALLIAGLIFPTLSLLTGIASATTRRTSEHNVSAVFIPFVGPVLLTIWVVAGGYSNWMIPIVWLLDLGTIAFLVVTPRLIRASWQTSVFTRIMTLRGDKGIQTAFLTLHRGGHYLLMKSWDPSQQPRLGIVVGQKRAGSWMKAGVSHWNPTTAGSEEYDELTAIHLSLKSLKTAFLN